MLRHPVLCNPLLDPLLDPANVVGWKAGASRPASLVLLWSSAKPLKSLKGVNPTYTDTPVVSAGGVVPGDGPSFADVVTWSDGGTLVVQFVPTVASADLVGDVAVFGPLYACAEGLKAKDGTNVASCATSWGVGDVVTGVVQVSPTLGMRVGAVVVSQLTVDGEDLTTNGYEIFVGV